MARLFRTLKDREKIFTATPVSIPWSGVIWIFKNGFLDRLILDLEHGSFACFPHTLTPQPLECPCPGWKVLNKPDRPLKPRASHPKGGKDSEDSPFFPSISLLPSAAAT